MAGFGGRIPLARTTCVTIGFPKCPIDQMDAYVLLSHALLSITTGCSARMGVLCSRSVDVAVIVFGSYVLALRRAKHVSIYISQISTHHLDVSMILFRCTFMKKSR